MVETIQRKLNDSAAARWTALVLIALMMFFAYMFVDVMSPLKSLVESARGWDSGTFGTYAASEYFLNVFVFFLIFAGIILDKMGIRFTGMLSASLMVAGAAIKLVGISEWFQTTELCAWLDSWWVSFPGSAKVASLGFMIFGCGCEMAGTTVSKSIAKWFQGKEMALAMGLEMAIARLGVFAVMWLAPMVSNMFDKSIVAPRGLLHGAAGHRSALLQRLRADGPQARPADDCLGRAEAREVLRRGVPRARPGQDFLEQDVLARGAALRALLLGHLPLPALCAQLPRGDAAHRRRIGRTALQLLPDSGHGAHPLPRCAA